MKKALMFVSLLIISYSLFANPIIRGTVLDAVTREPLQGAVIKLKSRNNNYSVVTGLDGSFTFKNIPSGDYEVEVTYVGYKKTEEKISITDSAGSLQFLLNNGGTELGEVKISSKKEKGSDASALTAERKSPTILNAVSAKTIEVSPDLSVANVTQRVSGVSLQRSNNGEGQYAIVRGMDKRYNYTLVNGIKIPSPDNKNRYVPLDIFPAELLERLEVTKALSPDMEGDAIGGVVNMVMKDAPDKFSIKANIGLGYAQSFFDGNKFNSFTHSLSKLKSPRIRNGESYTAGMKDFSNEPFRHESVTAPVASVIGISMGGRTLNNKLGILIAVSYQNTFRDVQSINFKTETSREDNTPAFTDIQGRNYSIQQQRGGIHSRFDYVFNKRNVLKMYAGFMHLGQNEYRFVSDTNLVLGRVGPGSGRIGNSLRTSRQIQNILNISVQGDHSFSRTFQMNWSVVYSKATGNQPDRGSLELSTGVIKDGGGNLVQQPVYIDNSTFRDWGRNSDEDKSSYLNFSYTSKIAGKEIKWSFGGMYRDKTRNSDYDKYNLRPDPSPQQYDGNVDHNTFAVFNPQGTSTDPLNYDAFEKVGAGYAMVKLEAGRFQLLGGARYENTKFNWITAAPKSLEGSTGSIKYYDVLPSLHLKYRLTEKQFLRVSYFSSISRPGFYELTPHTYDDGSSDYPEQGNPYLKRTTAENFDFRYEYFPKGIDQMLAGVFYKKIKNPIEYAIVQKGANATYYIPDNFGTGSNYGFEFDITKYFNSIGIKANYTFTNSRITTSKIRRFRKTNPDGSTTLTQENINQTRPLQGQSKNIGNLSLLYKNNKKGIDAQLAAVYTGNRINTVSPFLDNDVWQKDFLQMDFSAEVRIIKRFSVFTKINNILNTPYKLEIHQKNTDAVTIASIPGQQAGKNAFVRKDTYGANYLLGFRFKL